jgi:predicted DNA-binding transcriptional regulator AlpA
MNAPRRLVRGYNNLRAFVGRGETWIRAKIVEGKFPPPDVRDTRMVGWYEDTVSKWQAEQEAAQRRLAAQSKRGRR